MVGLLAGSDGLFASLCQCWSGIQARERGRAFAAESTKERLAWEHVPKEVCFGCYLEFLLTWGYPGQRA